MEHGGRVKEMTNACRFLRGNLKDRWENIITIIVCETLSGLTTFKTASFSFVLLTQLKP